MKKILLSLVFATSIFTVQAQTKVTKNAIIGKWEFAAMNVDAMLYYDIEKDSISLSPAILTQLATSGADSASAAEMMKGQFAALKEVLFVFNADGTYNITGSGDKGGGDESGTFTVDEATQTIFMTNKKKGEKKDIKASFIKERLALGMPADSGPKSTLEFKKGKD